MSALWLLPGCGMLAYREGQGLLAEGQVEQGLAKLEEAVKLDPKNAEYRIELGNRRMSIIHRLISSGELARREGRLNDAEKFYRQAQSLEPENVMARQGMDLLVQARRHQLVVAEAESLLKKGALDDLNRALEILRPLLAENPGHRPALNLKARVDEQRAKMSRPETKLAAVFRKTVSLEFRDAPLKSVMEVIARVSGLNFFYDHDIRPDLKATIFARNTTIEDAIRLVLMTNQLEYKVLNENSILVYPNTPQKQKDYQTLAIRSFYITNADVKAIANSIKTIVKTKDLIVDERLGILIMRDTPEAVRIAERIVNLQDLHDPEVMLEVEILEITRSRLLELGIQWPNQMTFSPLQFEGVPMTWPDVKGLTQDTTQVSFGNFIVNARKEDQDGNILANPRIRVRNKEKAKIQIGDRVPVITTTSTSTGFVSESVNYVDVGLKLEVEPNIYLDDEVAIKINLEVSNLVREIMSSSGTLSYQIGTRGANTVLRLKDGETQILAGLINDEDRSTANKFPFLGEVPILGRLFGSQKDDKQRSEILLSITPRIVRSIQRPDMLDAEFESGTESYIGARSLRLSSDEATPKENAPATLPNLSAPGTPQEAGSGGNTSASGNNPSPGTGTPGSITLNWQAPAQVKAGEQFSAVVSIQSNQNLLNMPIMLGFDPQLLQAVSVQEGDFFKQGNAQTNFSYRFDPVQGRVFASLIRQPANAQDTGINGEGSVIKVNFKALKASDSARLQLLSATPEPSASVILPSEQAVRILP
ncbi:MAG: secretin and TonB N-terminal domain-containing protein [Zoogloeaceae bacterium]|nr:secretin and TonB N-terminal domain-containing protein [Zoogloeaceae bacterium]